MGETTNNVIDYSGRYESSSVSSTKDHTGEEVNTSFMILHPNTEEACIEIESLKKTISDLHQDQEEACITKKEQKKNVSILMKETKNLSSTITSLEKEVTYLNSKLDHITQSESNEEI